MFIGRDPTNHFQIHDGEVSRRHAKIISEDDQWVLCDLDSANGVFINGIRTKKQVLFNGDRILLGKTLFLFVVQASEVEDSPRTTNKNVVVQPDEPDVRQSSIIQSIPSDVISFPFATSSDDPLNIQAEAHLRLMYHTTLVVSQTLDINTLLQRILELIFAWVQVDRGCILLFDPDSHQLLPRATRFSKKVSQDVESTRLVIDKSILDHVLERWEGVRTSDAPNDERWNFKEKMIREVICVPMAGRYGRVGVIYLDTLRPGDESSAALRSDPESDLHFSGDHLRLMIAIAHQAALAVEDTQYYRVMVQSERLAAVGQAVTTLSHHIKNILQGITGASHLIEMGLAQHDEQLIDKGWRIVEKNQTRISNLILDMLTFSKEREPALRLSNVNEIIADVVELLQSYAKECDVQLRFTPLPSMPRFFFDNEQLHRALNNIVLNGIEAMKGKQENTIAADSDAKTSSFQQVVNEVEEGVFIHLKYNSKSQMVMIIVDDSGPGIPITKRELLFRPFYSQKKGRGTGLGLPVAYKVAKEHEGELRVEDSPSGGARFIMELPVKSDSVF